MIVSHRKSTQQCKQQLLKIVADGQNKEKLMSYQCEPAIIQHTNTTSYL